MAILEVCLKLTTFKNIMLRNIKNKNIMITCGVYQCILCSLPKFTGRYGDLLIGNIK